MPEQGQLGIAHTSQIVREVACMEGFSANIQSQFDRVNEVHPDIPQVTRSPWRQIRSKRAALGSTGCLGTENPSLDSHQRYIVLHSLTCLPRSDLSLRRASHLWDVTVDLNRSIYHWIFAKNLPGDSPNDLGRRVRCTAHPVRPQWRFPKILI